MEKIRINQKGTYKIEVNDNGDYITINPNDTRLMGKLLNILADIEVKQKEFEEKAQAIISREDKDINIAGSQVPVTQNLMDYIKLLDDFCVVCRGYIDDIFGKGASQKIFGDVNDPDMFEDFFNQLEPHLEKNNITMKNMKEDLVKKYEDGEDGVI